jgi:hypothetical protein
LAEFNASSRRCRRGETTQYSKRSPAQASSHSTLMLLYSDHIKQFPITFEISIPSLATAPPFTAGH